MQQLRWRVPARHARLIASCCQPAPDAPHALAVCQQGVLLPSRNAFDGWQALQTREWCAHRSRAVSQSVQLLQNFRLQLKCSSSCVHTPSPSSCLPCSQASPPPAGDHNRIFFRNTPQPQPPQNPPTNPQPPHRSHDATDPTIQPTPTNPPAPPPPWSQRQPSAPPGWAARRPGAPTPPRAQPLSGTSQTCRPQPRPPRRRAPRSAAPAAPKPAPPAFAMTTRCPEPHCSLPPRSRPAGPWGLGVRGVRAGQGYSRQAHGRGGGSPPPPPRRPPHWSHLALAGDGHAEVPAGVSTHDKL